MMTASNKDSLMSAAKGALVFLLLLLCLLAAQVFLVSAALYFSKQQDASIEQPTNAWLDLAELISVSNPEVLHTRANFLRQKALLPEFRDQRTALLQQALTLWGRAAEIRPLWPYYWLSELNTMVLLDTDALVFQAQVEQIIQLAPNERGLDKQFLELAFYDWDKLTAEQQQWMLDRLAIVPGGTFNYVFSVAKKFNKQSVICTRLPYKKVKRICRAR
ncbi:MAG: hypothetical protein V7765_01830 [Oleispira sp.]